MNIKNKIIVFIIFLSVGLLPTDIFLYAQQTTNFDLAERFLKEKKIDSLKFSLDLILNDTLELNALKKANLFYLFGKYYDIKNKEEIALQYFSKAEERYRILKDDEKLADIQFAKYLVLRSREKLDVKKETEFHLSEYYKYALKNDDKDRLIKAYMGFAALYFNPTSYKESINFYDKAIEVCNEISDTLSLARINNNKGLLVSNFYQNHDSARIFYKKSLKLFSSLKKNDRIFTATLNLGNSYRYENKHQAALTWLHKADLIPIVDHKNNFRRLLYGLMSDSYENLNNYKEAHFYLTKYLDYKDSVDIKAQNIAISDIETKYQTAIKEKENIELKADKKKQEFYLIAASGTFLGFLIVGLLSYINLKRKREIAVKDSKLQHEKVLSLVKNQELTSLDSIIEGQEIERKRIAEDLHDNLGSTFAILKLQFDNYRASFSKGVDQVKQEKLLSNTENVLDQAYKTVRSMAHANDSGVMASSGLIGSVKSLANVISDANKMQIEVIDFGFDKNIESTLEITIFRFIQELITNIVKHSNAKKAMIDLTLFDDSIGIIVEDDGVGFDVNQISKNQKGLGLSSIKNRAEHLKGDFSIDTSIGKGTTVLINIPLSEEI